MISGEVWSELEIMIIELSNLFIKWVITGDDSHKPVIIWIYM